MLPIGGLCRKPEAQKRHQAAGCIGKVVDRVRLNGDAPAQKADGKLRAEEKEVAQKARKAGEQPIALTHARRVRILIVLYKQPQKQLCHGRPPPFPALAAANEKCQHIRNILAYRAMRCNHRPRRRRKVYKLFCIFPLFCAAALCYNSKRTFLPFFRPSSLPRPAGTVFRYIQKRNRCYAGASFPRGVYGGAARRRAERRGRCLPRL